MHVGSQSQDAVALPRVIDGLRAQGYSFGTIADILR
jgi:peptidoglycan/xylan/chitin deacetylase (PgdA/CDA1 family)